MRHASAHRIPDVGPARLPVPELSIVVPTFNEAANVPLLVAALDAALRGIAWEVIFVDDDSRDGTTDAVRNIGAADARVRCIRRIGRRGLSGASIEGMLSSSAGIVATMDGDLQHDETLLPAMLAQIRSGADVVVASRFAAAASASDGLSATRLKGSQLATQLARRMLGITVSDPMSGFFMMRRPAFERVAPRLSTQGFKILMDILASASEPLKTAELPLRFRPRLHGVSKLDNLVAMEYLSLLLAKASGDRLSMRFVLFGLVGAIGVGVHLLVLKAALAGSLSFVLAQGLAAYVAMTGNFFLNNALTYRDRRLTGWRVISGLLSFYAVCSIGLVANVGIGQMIHQQTATWWLAGLAGALMAAVFNYVATSIFTWRLR